MHATASEESGPALSGKPAASSFSDTGVQAMDRTSRWAMVGRLSSDQNLMRYCGLRRCFRAARKRRLQLRFEAVVACDRRPAFPEVTFERDAKAIPRRGPRMEEGGFRRRGNREDQRRPPESDLLRAWHRQFAPFPENQESASKQNSSPPVAPTGSSFSVYSPGSSVWIIWKFQSSGRSSLAATRLPWPS